ncbi:MAG: 1-acyl-sn-glycerol-3-phosphate acyltransferase [Bacteroidales bacterium]|nr:1-acyl-sn-glycerol-3-phosphate acyltransferase [Bacteroidales bacterium]
MSIKFTNLEDPSIVYGALKLFPSFVHNHIFYRNVYTMGLENIPEDGAVIFAPNHQNALMDALIIMSIKSWQPVFMARADIFAGQFVRRLLFFLKILPIFRIRDGKESLKQNDAVFEKAVEVLRKRRYLVIYPEASHKGIRKLRPLKKGITRIAFMAEEASNYTLDVKIVPVGINYQDYYEFRTDVLINFGKPISVKEYRSQYEENPQKAHHDLVQRITGELSSLIIDIRDTENYDNFEIARTIFAPIIVRKEGKIVNNFQNQLLAGRKVVEIMDNMKADEPDVFDTLNSYLRQYREGLKAANLRDWIIRRKFKFAGVLLRTLILIVLSPLALFGFVNNFIPYFSPFLLTNRVKDRNFHSSLRFALYVFLFPIWYTVLTILTFKYLDTWWLRVLYMVAVPITGIFSHHFYDYMKRVVAMWRLLFNKSRHAYLKLQVLRKKIVEIFVNRK